MRINSIDIPEWLLPELEALLETVPPQAIVSMARTQPILKNGYRNSVKVAPQLRKQLYKLLVREIIQDDKNINEVLQAHSLNQTLLKVLSRTVIAELYPCILAYYGYERVLLATVLDGRARVREQALPFLSKRKRLAEFPLSATDPSYIKERLKPFLKLSIELEITTASSFENVADVHHERECTECVDLQAARSTNKRSERRIVNLEKKLSKHEKRHKELLKKLLHRIELLRKKKLELEAAHENLKATFKQNVHTQVRKIAS